MYYVNIKDYGVFCKFSGTDAYVVGYIMSLKVNNETCYLIKTKINVLLYRLNHLGISYKYSGVFNNFNSNNNYLLYLYKAYDKYGVSYD